MMLSWSLFLLLNLFFSLCLFLSVLYRMLHWFNRSLFLNRFGHLFMGFFLFCWF